MLGAVRETEGTRELLVSGGVGLGVSGREPQGFRRGDITAVLDGRVYNRPELGSFESDLDAVVSLYERHGFLEMLAQLNGDFAVALYDARTKTLWLARDRFGVKPLYYAGDRERFAFASRPRSILSLPGIDRSVNPTFVALFAGCHYRYFDNDLGASPYRAVSQLPPAHALSVSDEGVRLHQYWQLQDEPDHTGPEEALAADYQELLLDAVSVRLRAAGRIGFTLSGGMDSSSVLASAVYLTGRKQEAFSTVYDDKTYDESDEIRSILDATVSQWHAVPVGSPDIFATIQRMVRVHDEPVATATWLAHFILCEQVAEQGFAGLFGGLGGDELNAGEYEHFFYHFADLRAAGREAELEREVRMWTHYHDHPVFKKDMGVVEDAFRRVVDLSIPGRCLPERTRLERYAGALNPAYFNLREYVPVMEHPFSSYLKNRTYQDLTRETMPPCLRAEDRQAAAFGLENYLPFLDHRLVEFMFRIPGKLKYREGVTKHLLREATRGILPEETRTRVKKTGWNAPAHVWFSGAGNEMLEDLVGSQRFRERGIYDVPTVQRLIREHEEIVASGEPRDHHMMFFWQLVNLELWLRSIESQEWQTDEALHVHSTPS